MKGKKIANKKDKDIDNERKKDYYVKLFRKFIFLTLICSLVPLLLVGWLISIRYTGFARSKMINIIGTQVEYHGKIIELFLKNRISKLGLLAQTSSKDYLKDISNLAYAFEVLNRDDGSILDLGVINGQGRHLSYIGPYDLMDKNYSQAQWFKEVMEKGLYISDMFMGFREVPHFVIAVAISEKNDRWILRATIDTEFFRSLVENVRIGKTGEVYLLNESGIFQTSPQLSGKIMGKSSFPVEEYHKGIRVRVLNGIEVDSGRDDDRRIAAQTWLEEPHWVLVVTQDYSEAFNDVNHANYAILVFLHLSALAILIVSVIITRHMIGIIKKRDAEANVLNKQLLQAGKMASIGELSAGVAHEINNPMAIILTERQILLDYMEKSTDINDNSKEYIRSSLNQIDKQVHRCKDITQGLLKFARRTKSVIETIYINRFLQEIVDLMQREARADGIEFVTFFDPDLPPILSDPSQLQQLFLNIINNAIDAHEGKEYGTVTVSTKSDDREEMFNVVISDTGSGIERENLDKIFDPFFTTKPVGKGTGLGLSICYSIVEQMGGSITVNSEFGKGSEFIISIPYRSAVSL
ncbi:MAG: GHKL domain-containing protein [Deltaproteobacteria bacterium]|nr:GHKL domain-containing protein [Deltaproteobacteria bacterium]